MTMKKPFISVSPSGLILLAFMASLAVAQSGGTGSQDAEKLGACVKGTVLTPSMGGGPGLGCDSVLKFVADGRRPDDSEKGVAKFAEAVGKCCGLLTDKARSDCTCPLQAAMDKVCKDGDAAATLKQQCGGGAGNSQDVIRRAGQLGACVDRTFQSAGGATTLGCDSVLRRAAAGNNPPGAALTAEFLPKCCSALTHEEDANSDCTCPLLDVMDKVCGDADVQALRKKCDPCERLFQSLDANDVEACRDKIKDLQDSCQQGQ